MTITILCTSVTLLIVLCYKTITRWLRQRCLSLPPGPAGVPIFGNLLTLNPELHTHFATLAKTHGPIFTIKLGNRLAIVISGVDMAKEVLRLQDDNFANRIIPAAAKTMEYIKSNIVSSPNGPTLRLLRKICVREMLGKASLDRVYWLRRREMKSLLIHLEEMAGEAVDVGAQMFLMVMNVITSMLWGGVVEGEEKRKEVGKEFREVVGDITEMLGKPNLSDFYPRLERFDVQGIQRKMKEKLVRLDGIFERIIEERKKNGGDGCEDKDFLGFMLRMEKHGGADDNSKSGTTTPFTINHVKALLMDMVVGGTETTSNTVEWAMAELIQKPEMMKKAQQELEQVVGKDNMVEESHLPKLTYLGSVIKEVLRLHPALPLLVPHCPSSTCTINGYTIPQGSQVFVNVWAIHRDPAIWENPLEFKPERFLGIDGSKWDFTGNDFRYFPFGSGRRICAGIPMAERIVGYALASLLHSFDWNLPEGTKLDLSERFGIVLKKATPLVAVPTPKLSHEVLAS
ncbi:Cytochrome P450 E-class group I protein [Dioscorea alata]|uniref:Cytochrome P450 E-class group I protein n=1 Tax=Dioscorea alata TaxID=55571 RepID=A0ACB7V4Q0_DIOAL|nr:Cytochrome P450 E-class group I protein [Dioscorea alata]